MRLALVTLLVMGAAAPAHAAHSEDVSLDYAAPDGCPAKETFRGWVASRSVRAHLVPARPGLRRFVVAIVAQDGEFAGVLRVVDRQGESSIRRLVAPVCADVALALALTAALAADASVSVPAGEPALPPATTLPVAPPEATSRIRWMMGVQVAATMRVVPEVLIGVPVFVDASLPRGTRPSARLALEYTSTATGEAVFTRLTSRLDLCPIELRAGRLVAQPCGVAEAGALWARGLGLTMPEVHLRPWLSLGAGARIAWRIGQRMIVEITASTGFPLVRDRFTIGGTVSVHEVPAVTFALAAGVALTFP